jgi:transcriptional regulator with XRE-family HTH domain/Zn-dependent peptidase ImmA (M78 family)
MEPNAEVGQRIAKAREFLGLTQAVIAEKLGLARTTQVAIEQGRRPVSVAELYRYAEVLSRPLDYFLGLGVWGKADFRPQFRLMAQRLDASTMTMAPRRPGRPKGPAEASPERLALMRFEGLCRNYLELEEVNGLPRAAMPELPAPRHHSAVEAEQLASTVRAHLDLGDAPIRDLRVRLEDSFGLRVYVLDQPTQLCAAAFHHPAIGGSVLLTEASIPRMRSSLAHALGHLLANREEAMVDMSDSWRRKTAVEAFAASFAASLLLPARGLRERFAAVHNEANEVSDMAVLYLARTFGVGVPALRARLEALRLVSIPTLRRIDEAIREAASGAGAEAEPAQELPDQPRWEVLPEYYVFLAMRAYRKELISRSRLAECLGTTEGDTAIRLMRYVASVSEPAGGSSAAVLPSP